MAGSEELLRRIVKGFVWGSLIDEEWRLVMEWEEGNEGTLALELDLEDELKMQAGYSYRGSYL